MNTNTQNGPGNGREASLKAQEGKEKPKTLSAEDRKAINEGLSDQNSMDLLSAAGNSSQRERGILRQKREARLAAEK
jgi:hypothetical protein